MRSIAVKYAKGWVSLNAEGARRPLRRLVACFKPAG
jgi:hypothetical protein